MSEPKFTPGPWHARWEGHPVLFPFVWQEHGHAVAKLCGKPRNPDWIVTRESDYADPEKVKANAALIAAAPEMYDYGETTAEALRLMLDSMIVPPAVRKLAQERIEEWGKIAKKARGE